MSLPEVGRRSGRVGSLWNSMATGSRTTLRRYRFGRRDTSSVPSALKRKRVEKKPPLSGPRKTSTPRKENLSFNLQVSERKGGREIPSPL